MSRGLESACLDGRVLPIGLDIAVLALASVSDQDDPLSVALPTAVSRPTVAGIRGGIAPNPAGPSPSLRILIVEDDDLIGMLLGEVLSELGHHICALEATESGAVAAAARFEPDLMIVDARLRQGSGIAAMEKILRKGFVPHVFVSGDPPQDLAAIKTAVVLQKPFLQSDLAAAIRRALDVDAPPPPLQPLFTIPEV